MSHIIRVDAEVYRIIVQTKARLEMATGQSRSMSEAVAFLIALSRR